MSLPHSAPPLTFTGATDTHTYIQNIACISKIRYSYIHPYPQLYTSFGLLIMALLTEKVPFHNLLLEEGQRAQLVSGQTQNLLQTSSNFSSGWISLFHFYFILCIIGVVRPTLPSTYPNKEFLSPLEALLADCTKGRSYKYQCVCMW